MTEPASTGIGGDMFALFYSAETKKVMALNGSGRSSSHVTLEGIRKELGLKDGERGTIPIHSVHAVTTPGAAAGWIDVLEKFGNGKLSTEEILTPAIELGEEGFPVSELSSSLWRAGESVLRNASPNFAELLKADSTAKDGCRAPRPGELFYNRNLAKTFKRLAGLGKKGFYEGPIAEAVVKVVQDRGGHLGMEDLRYHGETGTEEVEPISIKFNGQNISRAQPPFLDGEQRQGDEDDGVRLWECPPNGQGIVALMALGILEELERSGKIRRFERNEHNCVEYLHALIEALFIAFADATWFVTDPAVEPVPVKEMLSQSYLAERAKLFDPNRASSHIPHGSPAQSRSDTVYFAVTDRWGNGCSFIGSNYAGFGAGLVPAGGGFTLQNRGAGFTLERGHANALAAAKRPYHTIIPALLTDGRDGGLHTVYGVMGGYMQPQGHVQVLLNMQAFGLDPQAALDAPRFCIGAGTPDRGKVLTRTVHLEEGIPAETAAALRALGHDVELVTGWGRGLFGRGQVIRVHREDGRTVYSAGSDPRGDGHAVPA